MLYGLGPLTSRVPCGGRGWGRVLPLTRAPNLPDQRSVPQVY